MKAVLAPLVFRLHQEVQLELGVMSQFFAPSLRVGRYSVTEGNTPNCDMYCSWSDSPRLRAGHVTWQSCDAHTCDVPGSHGRRSRCRVRSGQQGKVLERARTLWTPWKSLDSAGRFRNLQEYSGKLWSAVGRFRIRIGTFRNACRAPANSVA